MGDMFNIVIAGIEFPGSTEQDALADVRSAGPLLVIRRDQRRRVRRGRDGATPFEIDANFMTRQRILAAVAVAAGLTTEIEEPPQQGHSTATLTPPSRSVALHEGRLILVAEDNVTHQKVIVQQLARLGLSADVAADGREALERWHRGDYALLLSDLHMPQMDGYELAITIRAAEHEMSGATRRLPIVALTASVLKGQEQRCFDVGMDDFLSKPTSLADLKAVLEKWLPRGTEKVGAGGTASGVAVAVPGSAPLDVSVLAALVGNDPTTIREFLFDFRASAAAISEELSTACASGEMERVQTLAHKLKSSARSVGARALGELCAELEAAGKAGQRVTLADLWHRFAAEKTAVDAALVTLTAEGVEKGKHP